MNAMPTTHCGGVNCAYYDEPDMYCECDCYGCTHQIGCATARGEGA